MVVELQYITHLLRASEIKRVSTSGLDDEEDDDDDLELSKQGGGISVWDR